MTPCRGVVLVPAALLLIMSTLWGAGRGQTIAQTLRFVPSTWESQIEFQAPGFSPGPHLSCWGHLGSEPADRCIIGSYLQSKHSWSVLFLFMDRTEKRIQQPEPGLPCFLSRGLCCLGPGSPIVSLGQANMMGSDCVRLYSYCRSP